MELRDLGPGWVVGSLAEAVAILMDSPESTPESRAILNLVEAIEEENRVLRDNRYGHRTTIEARGEAVAIARAHVMLLAKGKQGDD